MQDSHSVTAESAAERRRFHRVRVDLPGRLFIPSDAREAHCRIIDMSAGGAAISCDIMPELGTDLVLYVDGFGRFECHVVRRRDQGFGVCFVCTQAKRERTAEQLMLFLNKSLVDDTVLRRREQPQTKGFAKFTREDGTITHCEVMDILVNGVSLKTGVKPPIGEYVLIAKNAGRVTHHHVDGIGVEFVGQDKPVQEPSSAA